MVQNELAFQRILDSQAHITAPKSTHFKGYSNFGEEIVEADLTITMEAMKSKR